MALEPLESRVVLSASAGQGLLGSLSYVGVVTSPIVVPPAENWLFPWNSMNQNSQVSTLGSDVVKLENELQTLAARSGVTISDLESLTTDSQSIAQSGFHFQTKSLSPVIAELATAVAGGTSTAQAHTDFTALFAGSGVSTSVINATFGDLVKLIKDSNITTTDFSAVASDEAAIQTDLSNLPWGAQPLELGLLDLDAGPSVGLSLSSGAITLPTIIVGPAPIPIGLAGNSGLLGSLNDSGVVTSPVVTSQIPSSAGTSASGYVQLKVDLQKLQTELETLATRSGITIADLQSLSADSQAIARAGFYLNPQTLNPVISELATAIAGGASTTKAAQDFTNLFSGSNVSSTVINTTFSDLVKTITDSKVAPTDLTTVASDKSASQTDLQNLYKQTAVAVHRARHIVHRIVRRIEHPRIKFAGRTRDIALRRIG